MQQSDEKINKLIVFLLNKLGNLYLYPVINNNKQKDIL